MIQILLIAFSFLKCEFVQGANCETKVCQEYSEKLKSNIDFSVKPCDDFYQVKGTKLILRIFNQIHSYKIHKSLLAGNTIQKYRVISQR